MQFVRLVSEGLLEQVFADVAWREPSGSTEQVTPAQFEVLRYIDSHHRSSVGQVSTALGLTSAAVTKAVGGLAEGRVTPLVVRLPDTDRRVVRLSTTKAGAALVAQLATAIETQLMRVVESLPVTQRGELKRGLRAFLAAAVTNERAGDWACLRCGAQHSGSCVIEQAGFGADCEPYRMGRE
ncbi:MAG TPA: hypothetical protein DCZ72_04340 [Armatimonadetes bacterium]|nr:hypothetical protein [Armatimonadota bacterium]